MNAHASAISVIICTRNPRPHFLRRAMDALRVQTLPTEYWDFSLIDDGSAEPVALDLDWHPNARVIRIPPSGLTGARLKGIETSPAPLLLFVDDDNVLAPDYLEMALRIGDEWPLLGTWGAESVPEFEIEPPEWTRRYWPAVRQVPRDLWSNVILEAGRLSIGAGMCVRREVAETYAAKIAHDDMAKNLDRSGASLGGGGDTDISYTACSLGLGNGAFGRLKLVHLMPKERMEEKYLLRLTEDMACSQIVLDHLWGIDPPPLPPLILRIFKRYQMLRIPPRERRFEGARIRGYQRGRDAVQKIKRRA